MAFRQVPQQPAEHIQQGRWNWRFGRNPWSDEGPRRTFPCAEPFIQHFPRNGSHTPGWHKGDRHLHHFKPNYYWTRPHDGKRSGTLGRLKDALTGEGADVFITINGDKRAFMRDRPQRWQWSGWSEEASRWYQRRWFDPDAIEAEFVNPFAAGWTERKSGGRYNFRTRRYEPPQVGWTDPRSVWMNAQWRPGAKRSSMKPLNHQTAEGLWWSTVPWQAGNFVGGRPRR